MPLGRGGADTLEIRLLGTFGLSVGGVAVDERAFVRRKAKLLVKLLAVEPRHQLHREQILDLLWPDLDPEAAADALYKCLSAARRALEPEARRASKFLVSRDQSVGLAAPGGLRIDADEFERAARDALASGDAGGLERALAVYGGDLLADDPYEDWAVARREQLRALRLEAIARLVEAHERAGRLDAALVRLDELLAVDPASESAHRRAMRLYAEAGRRGLALRQFQLCVEALRRELDVEPEAATHELYESILAGEVAPVRPEPARAPAASNLPHRLTSFVGRSHAIAAVAGELGRSRLVTLVGPGGVGKTRLALEVARGLAEALGGAWLVELAAVRDEATVATAVAEALGVRAEALDEELADRRLLVVLDNCEQVIDGCAAVAERLLAACPGLCVLATSRERLGVAGEVVWRVPGMALPDAGVPVAVRDLLDAEATRLFLDRARLREPGFQVTDREAPAVARICRRLDGMPLAIELATACLAALSVEEIEARLEDRFALLTADSRTAEPRQRTLAAVFDWSHELLSAPEQTLLRRISAFVGGFSLEAAEAVCGGEDLVGGLVLPLLRRLVDASLVGVERGPGRTRYATLETVRAYARARLAASGEEPAVLARHRAWCLGVAERAMPELFGPRQAEWLARLDAERDNLRSALERARAAPDADATGLRLAVALRRYWDVRGLAAEGRAWLERLLAAHPEAPARLCAKALYSLGVLASAQGEPARAKRYLEACLAVPLGEDAAEDVAHALHVLGSVEQRLGDPDRATELQERSIDLNRRAGNRVGVAISLMDLGLIAMDRGDDERAAARFEECLALSREVGNARTVELVLHNLGDIALRRGELDRAEAFLEESMAVAREIGDRNGLADSLQVMGNVALARGDHAGAAGLHARALAEHLEIDAKAGIAYDLEAVACAAAARGDAERAFRLAGAAASLRDRLSLPRAAPEQAALDRHLGRPEESLLEEGRALSLDEAVALALER